MHRRLAWTGPVLLLLVSGCISFQDPLGRQRALAETQREYTNMVRWGDLERAERFVAADCLDDFKRAASGFDELRVTDHEIGDIEYTGEGTAHVTVTYKGYSIARLVEHTSRERQEWVRDGMDNDWQVRPQLDLVAAELQGLPAPPSESDSESESED